MSLVSRPCRYDARSAPETTTRPRSDRSMNAARWRAASYAAAETPGIMVLCWDMPSLHSIRAALAALALALPYGVSAQQPPPPPMQLPDAGAANFTIFLRGVAVGSEQVAMTRGGDGWT